MSSHDEIRPLDYVEYVPMPDGPPPDWAPLSFEHRLRGLVSDITLPENFTLIVGQAGTEQYLQIQCYRRDVVTGEMGLGFGGKARISTHATDSEIVQTAFGLYKSYVEHEARETFEWRGRRVFGPHIDVRALWQAAPRTDARPQATS